MGKNPRQEKENTAATIPKQIMFIRADQLLNITITKTGLDLAQRLSALFDDVYNKRLSLTDDDNRPMLSLFNGTGQELLINNLDGLEVNLISYFYFKFVFFLLSLLTIHH